MKYIDPKGKETEISYSTEVQERLEKTLRESLVWRRKMYYTLNAIKWILIVTVLLGAALLAYLDSKNAFTIVARKIFCS